MYEYEFMSDYLDPANEELLKDFFSEAESQIEILERNILVLENDPDDREAIDEIFRAAHTLKGNSATVEMHELSEFTHLVEDVLDDIRNEKLNTTERVVNCLLTSIDIIKLMLEERSAGDLYDKDTSSIVNELKSFLTEEPAKAQKVPQSAPLPEKRKGQESTAADIEEYEFLEFREAAADTDNIFKIEVGFDEDNPMNTVGGIQIYAALNKAVKILKTVPDFDDIYSDVFHPIIEYYVAADKSEDDLEEICTITDVTKSVSVAMLAESRHIPIEREQAGQVAEESGERVEQAATEREREEVVEKQQKSKGHKKQVGSILRVDSRRIDDLLNLVTETVINKATFNQISSLFSESLTNFQETDQTYREAVKEIIDSLVDSFEDYKEGKSIKAIKKEVASKFGDIIGGYEEFGTKIKSTISLFNSTAQILSRISSELQEGVMKIRMVPVSHIFSRFPRLVRDLSKALKKDVNLHIEGEDTELDKSVIEDLLDPLIHCVRNSMDHGIESPAERIAAEKTAEGNVYLKAANEGNMIIIEILDDGKGIDVEKVKAKAIERGIIHPSKNLSDVEAFNLIFDPGFSTSSKVTNLSGRGVGLDVVRKQIEKLNGTVTVWSEKGQGTKMTINLPLTLAIIQGLLIRVGKEIYAIPIASVVESHRIEPSEIRRIDNHEVFNIREDVYSLIRMNRLFKIEEEEDKKHYFIVLVGSGDKKVGLLVDSLIGEEDVVIKPLKDRFTNSPGIAGATILGDGTVALIIDVIQLLELGLKNELVNRQSRAAIIQ